LAALKLSISSVQIVTKEKLIPDSLSAFSTVKVISFGVPVEPPINSYESTERNGIKIIYADTLDTLDDLKKRNLWQALKTMFSV
jgi:hypothetical protein